MDIFEQVSTDLADRVARAAPSVVAIHTGRRRFSGILWRPDVVLASEQTLGDDPSLSVYPRRRNGPGRHSQAATRVQMWPC